MLEVGSLAEVEAALRAEGFFEGGADVLTSYALTAPTWPCGPDATATECFSRTSPGAKP